MPGYLRHREEKHLVSIWLAGSFVGAIFIINSYILNYVMNRGDSVAGISAFMGALILGIPVIIRAIRDLVRGELHMNELVAIAILACFALEEYTTAGIVAFLVLLGDIIEHRTAIGVRESIESLLRLTPVTARLIEGNEEREVEASVLEPGSFVRVRPGENVPADGVIREGNTTLNEATITGESFPVDKGTGDNVFAGTSNLTGAVRVEVTRAGEDTTLGKVRHLITDAEATKIPIMTVIDRYIGWYTPFVLMVAAIILAVTRDVNNAITALIVTCPCAIILANPTAMVAALSAAARLGILVKDVRDFQTSSAVTAVVFDKTGTLTTGMLAAARVSPAPGVKPEDLLRAAGAAERHSNHPAARAIITVVEEAGIALPEPEDFKETWGMGVEAKVEGRKVVVGRREWLVKSGVDFAGEDARETGYSVLHVAADGRLLGWIGLEDKVRPEARRATEQLKIWGVRRLTILTGDRESVAGKVSQDLGCDDYEAKCLPERKLEVVNSMKKAGYKVAVVGDGINDAPALAAGDIGIAMGAAGSDVAISSATIALMSEDLTRLPMIFRLSRKTTWVVAENLTLAGVFIVGGLTLAGFGILTPIIAALLHTLGSWVVIFNSARIVRFGEEVEPYRG